MGCYPYASGPQLYSNDPISMEACAAGCTNTYASLYAFKYYYSYFNPDIQATDIRYVCECGNNLGYTPSDWTYGESCGQANFYDPPITTHPPGSSGAPSGWIRRQLKERLAREAGQKALAVCPKDMTACQTSSEDDSSFESWNLVEDVYMGLLDMEATVAGGSTAYLCQVSVEKESPAFWENAWLSAVKTGMI
ncbi:hypothetical protein I204_07317 [Kwoniella mangroviensis CBS 8886]|nr:hypothetical protein I204_07317 [Kwoniella mangroviensis CBS 8886]